MGPLLKLQTNNEDNGHQIGKKEVKYPIYR